MFLYNKSTFSKKKQKEHKRIHKKPGTKGIQTKEEGLQSSKIQPIIYFHKKPSYKRPKLNNKPNKRPNTIRSLYIPLQKIFKTKPFTSAIPLPTNKKKKEKKKKRKKKKQEKRTSIKNTLKKILVYCFKRLKIK